MVFPAQVALLVGNHIGFGLPGEAGWQINPGPQQSENKGRCDGIAYPNVPRFRHGFRHKMPHPEIAEQQVTQLGIHGSAPYSGAIFNLASGRYEYEPEGVLVQKKAITPAAARKDSIYGKLTAALARLTALVGAFRGRTNKDVAKFADQINMLCDKWQ